MKVSKSADWRSEGRGIWSTAVTWSAIVVAGCCAPAAVMAGTLSACVSDAGGVKSLQSAEVEIVELRVPAPEAGAQETFGLVFEMRVEERGQCQCPAELNSNCRSFNVGGDH